VVCNHTEGSAATHAFEERQPIRNPIQRHRFKRPHGASFISDVTRLFAGGLRSRGSIKTEKSDNLTILVVWEPILPSDWSRPTRPVMARIPDRRVIQFWDKDHLIAKELDSQLHTKQPNCCRSSGTLWDLAALYPRGTKWNETEPLYVNGPVVKVETDLQNQTSKLLQSTNAIQAFSSKPIR
jgi:hypothetical protein